MFYSEVSIRDTHKSPKIVCRLADSFRGVFQTWKDTESDANIRLVRNAAFLNRIFICIPSEIEIAAKPCRRADSFRPEENEIRVPCPAKAGQGIKAASCKPGPQLFPRGTVSCRFLSRLPCCFSPAAQPRPKRFAQQNLAEGRIHSARVRSALMEPLPSGECPIKDF